MLIKFRKISSLILSLLFLLHLNPMFVEAESSEDLQQSYGVLCYEYKTVYGREYTYSPNRVNLGDYVQSLAARQYLPKNCKLELINRDSLKSYDGPEVKMIMNGWYFLNEKNETISDKIDPIYVSVHINNPKDLTPNAVDGFKKHQPIGCRDYNTQKVLASHGVKTYFSGCLTTTLDIDYKAPENERTDKIIFCDYNLGDYPQADEYLKSLKNYNFNNIESVTHDYSKNSTHEERFEQTKKLLKKYARAKLVVTSRIHCALPCLALGTPVILVKKVYDSKRFGGLYGLLNTIGGDEEGNFLINVKTDKNKNVVNSENYKKYANRLKCRVKEILKS